MGTKLFGIDIAKKVKKAFKGKLQDLTLTSITTGTRSSSDLSAGTNPSEAVSSGEGIKVGKSSLPKGSILPETKDVVVIIAESLDPSVTPKENDTITINSDVLTIVDVSTDPAEATHTCQVK